MLYQQSHEQITDLSPYNTPQQQPFYCPLSRTTRVSRYQKKHSPSHHPDHHPISISFFHLPRHTASHRPNPVIGNPPAQPSSMSPPVHLPVWSPPPHIPHISSPNQCPLLAAHAHTIATCFAAVSILYHLFLIFLATPYLELFIFYLKGDMQRFFTKLMKK